MSRYSGIWPVAPTPFNDDGTVDYDGMKRVIDCMVALPGQLFYSTQIPACLWILAKDRSNGLVKNSRLRDRRGEILFIDARNMGALVDRTRRELHDDDVARIAATYHAWRGETDAGPYADIPGFCKAASLDDVRKHGHVLTPGRYVGAAAQEEDGEPFEQKMQRLAAQWREQQALSQSRLPRFWQRV